jgi:hypothetical protein
MADSRTLNILYLVHDVRDPAVAKRVTMLRDGGAAVTVMGFRRAAPLEALNGAPVIDLGETRNGQFTQRMLAVLRTLATLQRHRGAFADADAILARNLEMLAIGVRGRALQRGRPRLVYECLDIHRLMLGHGLAGMGLRALEGWLSRRASALITSSPAFVSEYFETRSRVRLPTLLVENKVYPMPVMGDALPRPPGPPWRIGWFGAIRCRESLQILKDLVRGSEGAVEVVIRGRPAYDQFDDFDAETRDTPGLSFLGPYANPGDLPAIYRDVHFNWAIDRFEKGLNSSWLLPNRLYEGGLFSAVPIAQDSVETGRYLKRSGLGVVLPDDLANPLREFFRKLSVNQYHALEAEFVNFSLKTWTCDIKQCIKIVEYIRDLHANENQ